MNNAEIYKNKSLKSLKGEIWRPIPNYKSYLASSLGRIKSFSPTNSVNRKDKILSQHKNKRGYPCVNLQENGIKQSCRVHRLILMAFIPNPMNKKEVNHKNLIKTDNTLQNLEWATGEENILHAQLNNAIPVKKERLKRLPVIKSLQYLGAKTVYAYNMNGKLIGWYGSIKIFCRRFNVQGRTIKQMVNKSRSDVLSVRGMMLSFDKSLQIAPYEKKKRRSKLSGVSVSK